MKSMWIAAVAAATLATVLLVAGVALASPAGDLDPTFDGDGKRVFGDGAGTAALVQPDGKILFVTAGVNVSGVVDDFTLTRLHPDGSPDMSFDGDGTALADFGGEDTAYGAALQPDGKIVVAGSTLAQGNARMAVARFNTDGSLDASFAPGDPDGDGRQIIEDAANYEFRANALAVQPDGRIVLAGFSHSGLPKDDNFVIKRLTPKGAVEDTTFDVDFGGSEMGNAVALQPDGKIVVAGGVTGAADAGMAVARFDSDGAPDMTFGGTGKRVFGTADAAQAVLVQPDGNLVLVGSTIEFVVSRLKPNGEPDASFGSGGTFTTDFGGALALTAALQPDGKILVAGIAVADFDFAVVRLLAAGAPDPSFGSAGKSTFTQGGIDAVRAMALQADGRIVLAGQVDTRVALARLKADPRPVAGGGGPAGKPSVPRCAGKRATIVGTAGRDRIRGTRRRDVIAALGGNDVIRGLAGNDIVCAGRGNDLVAGGGGRDRLLGGPGRDRLVGGPGRDRLIGGLGRDVAKQ
jgi:uncharacterized delta-60 repeat protein